MLEFIGIILVLIISVAAAVFIGGLVMAAAIAYVTKDVTQDD